MPRTKNELIEWFILAEIERHPRDLVPHVAEKFNVSRQRAYQHVRRLVKEGVITTQGRTKGRRYQLAVTESVSRSYAITPALEENAVWQELFKPALREVRENVRDICQWGLTEMLNNAIEHSDSPTVFVSMVRTAASIDILVWDQGVGIFNKIQKRWRLDDARHAMLELSKGKLTTDPEHHSGEGIFFTSRMVDMFALWSGTFFFSHFQSGNDALFEMHQTFQQGTVVRLSIHPQSERTVKSVLDEYAGERNDYGFARTHIFVELSRHEGEKLISRSQAKRLLNRATKFVEVVLDFKGVTMIGQAFADEVFRVFTREHPEVHILPINMSPDVKAMVQHVQARVDEDSRGTLPLPGILNDEDTERETAPHEDITEMVV